MRDSYTETLKKVGDRITDLEKLVKLLLINELVDEIDSSSIVSRDNENISDEKGEVLSDPSPIFQKDLMNKFTRYGLKIGSYKKIYGLKVFSVIVSPEAEHLDSVIPTLYRSMKESYPKEIPLFEFESISKSDRKQLQNWGISYAVKKKEIWISGDRR